MSDVIQIRERMWKAFGKSAPEIMDLAQKRIVALGNKTGYSRDTITFREQNIGTGVSYKLGAKIQDKEGIELTQNNQSIEVSKTISDVPYAVLHEQGGDVPYSSKKKAQLAAMFFTMKAIGSYKPKQVGNGASRHYPARQYVHKGLESLTPREIAKPIIEEIKKEFTDAKVIVIGD